MMKSDWNSQNLSCDEVIELIDEQLEQGEKDNTLNLIPVGRPGKSRGTGRHWEWIVTNHPSITRVTLSNYPYR